MQSPPFVTVRGNKRFFVWGVVVIVVVLLAGIYGNHERDHDIPNPFWGVFNRMYTYRPPANPPSADFLVTHPETILNQYIHDYISIAGTYPCAAHLDDYQPDNNGESHREIDPILKANACTVHRPVLRIVMKSVYVTQIKPGVGGVVAKVTYQVSYVDGEQWTDTEELSPAQGQSYMATYLHLDCWASNDMIFFYPFVLDKFHQPKPTIRGLQDGLSCNP